MEVVEFRLPDVGEGIHEAEIVRWLVEEGERVAELEPMVEVQTDKALVELPAPTTGVIREILSTPGTIARVGEVLVVMEATGLKLSGTAGTWHSPDMASPVTAEPDEVDPQRRPKATPGVRHYAREQGVALQTIAGTGPGGRITKEDVRTAAATPVQTATEPQVRRRTLSQDDSNGSLLWTAVRQAERERQRHTRPAAEPVDAEGDSVNKPFIDRLARYAEEPSSEPTRVPFRGVRRATAEQVKRSAFTVPHVTAFDECDATELVRLRNKWNKALESEGQRVSYLPFLIKATVSALKKYPYFNARLDESAQEIELLSNYHVGIAVDTPDGLFVPVLRHADRLTVQEIGEEIYRLSAGARARTLTSEDLRGSTFSITNMGPIGSMFATPIINFPEVAILAVHQIQRKPVAIEEQVVIRDILTLSLSFDHRVIDGAMSVRFLNHLKALIADPEQLMLELR